MTQNILITGAAGYIGGSILADFISRTSGPIKDARISAAVRSEAQAQRLSKLGVNVIQADLSNEVRVREAILQNEIDIVLHIASSMAAQLAANVINALGERRKASGSQTYFVQSGVTALFSVEGGWPYGEVRDDDPTIFEKEKEIGGPNPVRQTNVLVTELAKAQGVTSFHITLPHVYGRGTGEWSKVSSTIPAYVKASIAHNQVYKFDVEGRPPAVHISDLVSLYALLTSKILQREPIPSGELGHYFGFNHRAPYWAVMDRIAISLHARGLVTSPEVKTWPNYKMAAESLGFPELYIRPMTMSTGDIIPVNVYKLGWQPEWNEQRYLENIDDEVQAALDLDTIKSSRYDDLFKAGN